MASGLMNGIGSTTFGPKESAKREQAAVVIFRSQNQEVYTIFGEYTLAKEDGRWKILLFAEELQ